MSCIVYLSRKEETEKYGEKVKETQLPDWELYRLFIYEEKGKTGETYGEEIWEESEGNAGASLGSIAYSSVVRNCWYGGIVGWAHPAALNAVSAPVTSS